MKIKDTILITVMIACLLPAVVGAGEEEIRKYAGKILVDTASNGEAWYVNPDTLQRVYLGRPDEALQRLTKRAVWIPFASIEKIAVNGFDNPDQAYAEQMSGYVLAPSDLIGAPWYVHPLYKKRIVLATPHDAWNVMKMGEEADTKTLKMIPVETDVEFIPNGDVKVREVLATDLLRLEDNTEVRLMSVDAPDNASYQLPAMSRLTQLISDNDMMVCLEPDTKDENGNGQKLRMVKAGTPC